MAENSLKHMPLPPTVDQMKLQHYWLDCRGSKTIVTKHPPARYLPWRESPGGLRALLAGKALARRTSRA